MKYLADVHAFQEKFEIPQPDRPLPLDHLDRQGILEFRLKFLREELEELEEAVSRDDMEGVLDALVDGVYVYLGTALMFGLDFDEAWDRVQAANMAKERAKPTGENSRRLSPWDVVKPEGWRPPDLSDLVSFSHRRREISVTIEQAPR